ncbi:hypothetical protein Taro_021448 [Colocasia esculenta]|uniref:Uncharacterized protein n=1 Tax=Colocasia esculenta TaxID=4460 RepID=A0A843V2G9_COLES|nr:hypothetical protein [Colocasia esculenta]
MVLHGTTSVGQNGSCDDAAVSQAAAFAGAVDRTLLEAGRRLQPSQLRELAQRLEGETTVTGVGASHFFAPEPYPARRLNAQEPTSVCYEPVVLRETGLESPLSALSLSPSDHSNANAVANLPPSSDQVDDGPAETPPSSTVDRRAMTEKVSANDQLLQLLVACAEYMQNGDDTVDAFELLQDMRMMVTRAAAMSPTGKVANHLIDALYRRLCYPPTRLLPERVTEDWAFYFYYHFHEACPFHKFAHLAANQAILEACRGHDRVHIIDLNLQNGVQWPALMQALVVSPCGPPALRITGVSFPSPGGRPIAPAVGEWLTQMATSVGLDRFSFRAVATNYLEELEWRVEVPPGEAVAVNCALQLHRLLHDTGAKENTIGCRQPIDTVFRWLRGLKPNVVTVAEQDANHNAPVFADRFREALSYYSCMFECLEVEQPVQPRSLGIATVAAETYLRRELMNVVSCEGAARVERHEPLVMWRWRMRGAGFEPAPLSPDTSAQARLLLAALFSGGENYTLRGADGCLTLGWRGRPLIGVSAWKPDSSSANTA